MKFDMKNIHECTTFDRSGTEAFDMCGEERQGLRLTARFAQMWDSSSDVRSLHLLHEAAGQFICELNTTIQSIIRQT